MDKNFGRKLSESLKQNEMYKKKIMNHIADKNQLRKNIPAIFDADSYDNT